MMNKEQHNEQGEQYERDEQKSLCTGVFFAQGEDAEELLEMLDEEGSEAVLDYLGSAGVLDQEDGEEYDIEEGPWGIASTVEYHDDSLILSYNRGLGTIGVHRIVEWR